MGGFVISTPASLAEKKHESHSYSLLLFAPHNSELAHNLGRGHANQFGVPYQDDTGYMAAAWPQPDWPLKCFNAANNYQFGWYADRTLTVKNPVVNLMRNGGARHIKLAAFVDYSLTGSEATTGISGGISSDEDEYVLVNLADKYFLQFNAARDFNVHSEEMQNQVVLVEQGPSATNLLDAQKGAALPPWSSLFFFWWMLLMQMW